MYYVEHNGNKDKFTSMKHQLIVL